MADEFVYNEEHQIVICRVCQACIVPTAAGQVRHLRAPPHKLTGERLQATAALLAQYPLRSLETLVQDQTRARPAIQGLQIYQGFSCGQEGCGFITRSEAKTKLHDRTVHGIYAKTQDRRLPPRWTSCALQSFFATKNLLRYFVVQEQGADQAGREAAGRNVVADRTAGQATADERALFSKLAQTLDAAERDVWAQGSIVQAPAPDKVARVPWLVYTGFEVHLQGLGDEEIRSSYSLPSSDGGPEGDNNDSNQDGMLSQLLAVAEAMLWRAYERCSDTGPNRAMTRQRAQILNAFYDGGEGRTAGFRRFKNASTLRTYFDRAKQLLVFYYRVVQADGGHFTPRQGDEAGNGEATARRPEDEIEASNRQKTTMATVLALLQQNAQEGGTTEDAAEDEHLQAAVRRLFVALICQRVGNRPFRSPVLSFCAMLARRIYTEQDEKRARRCVRGSWHEPGNFNSRLSALTWTAQLVLFDCVCSAQGDDEDGIPARLQDLCQRYFQQHTETTFGHILQWRLYLFKVSKAAVTAKQARWSLDGQTVQYQGTEMRMAQVLQLATWAYSEAYRLLYDELLFGADNLRTIEAWAVRDDLDEDAFGASWLANRQNEPLLGGARQALLRTIQGDSRLRQAFVREGALYPQAVAIYEAHVQDFLAVLAVLLHITPAPPLRSSELFSVQWQNTARRRHVFVWEKMVLLHVQYHKGQEQMGAYKDNVRFLPRPVGDLLLTFLAYVPPLRLVFLRQTKPKALLSPYLWSRLDGTGWKDASLSTCLRKACAQASVPGFQVAWWRQVAASITKEKFSAREQSNFLSEDGDGDEVEDETDLAVLAASSNHSFRTFNHAYAGTTTLTLSTLLHRGYRASTSWHRLFRFDQLPPPTGARGPKRPRAGDGGDELLRLWKRARVRKPVACREEALLTIARRLYKDGSIQFRTPGQREGVLATVGPQPAEQVVVVLGTGSGKTLVVMIGAAADGAETTILVLPAVALRGDMLRRLTNAGIRYHVWVPGSTRRAPLVVVSAEAACTGGFLEYAHWLVDRQELDRIVVDECHLTITAQSYRPCMRQLGWYVRQVRTQTVWLTATLPPSMEAVFFEQNKLVRPCIVRESTNRRNIRYSVRQEKGRRSAVDRAVRLVESCLRRGEVLAHKDDRIIVYCTTRAAADEVAEKLGCGSYTSDTGTEEEKKAMLARWLGPRKGEDGTQTVPVIAATSALGVGFDYAHVRLVVHAGAPRRMTDFAQESGRAGRDGQLADSIVLLGPGGDEAEAGGDGADAYGEEDERAMRTYVSGQHCLRGVLSEFLDARRDWRWCMAEDAGCSVCPEAHEVSRPTTEAWIAPAETGDGDADDVDGMAFTGPDEVWRQEQAQAEALRAYERDLATMASCCLYCRFVGRPWAHAGGACAWRMDWIAAKRDVLQACQADGKPWMPAFVVCWKCYQPQQLCRVADPEAGETVCQFPDMVLPACYGVFHRPGAGAWLQKHFGRHFPSVQAYMRWLGNAADLGGVACVQANCVLAEALGALR